MTYENNSVLSKGWSQKEGICYERKKDIRYRYIPFMEKVDRSRGLHGFSDWGYFRYPEA